MKILVIQLARLGDIYLSWPALRAMRRQNPQAQIHVLTRPRFAAALEGLTAIDQIKLLSSKELLEPIIKDQPDINQSFNRVSDFVESLKAEKYDWILNFSFSPASSYLVHAISDPETKISGYTRYEDGFLKIPDDMSAYFYAQVGVDRPNRFHLAEIFGTLAEVDLESEDWSPPVLPEHCKLNIPEQAIVIHIGASEQKKSISAHKWGAILSHLRKQVQNPIVLIGSSQERAIAESIVSSTPSEGVYDFVGKTALTEIFQILKKAALLIGADSAPIHMASLMQTPTLNLSFACVNFWETGPRSSQSYILKSSSEEDMASDKVAALACKILSGQKTDLGVITLQKGSPCYWALTTRQQEIQWQMVQAIYQGTPFPLIEESLFLDGISKLKEINQLMLEQMEFIQAGGDLAKVAGIIDRGEEIIQAISKLVPSLSILIRWYQTEKIRIGPGEPKDILKKTMHVHELMKQALEIYSEPQTEMAEAL